MAITPGTQLGPYEIVAPLGAGGMGEVWRARDTRLSRDVAMRNNNVATKMLVFWPQEAFV